MAIMPGVVVRLIPRHNQGKRIQIYNRVNLHVAVSEATSLFGHFSRVGDCSHFYVAKDGTIEQYMDTVFWSKADLDGNDATISVETQGGVKNAQGEPWTDAQIASLVRIWVWARDTHGIMNKLATSSRAVNNENRGLSYHRLGVPGYPTSVGGVQYSRSRGKICPGDAKIAQIPGIFNIALGAAPSPVPSPPPQVTPPAPSIPQIDPDGRWGEATTRRLQQVLGTPQDGVISHQWKTSANQNIYAAQFDKTGLGSTLVKEMQRRLGVRPDGLCGSDTIKALQRHYGTQADGVISGLHSNVVEAMQRALNEGRF